VLVHGSRQLPSWLIHNVGQTMLIKNYGRLWERSAVHWGGGNLGPGNLGAIGEWNKGGADFREQVAIYILHDSNYSSIYVGQTGAKEAKLFHRLAFHNRNLKMQRWDISVGLDFVTLKKVAIWNHSQSPFLFCSLKCWTSLSLC